MKSPAPIELHGAAGKNFGLVDYHRHEFLRFIEWADLED
jgi:hypothetical protein